MSISAKVVADSINSTGTRLTTFEVVFWSQILPEVLTHRVFSRSTSSNRAIPTAKVLKQVIGDPAGPCEWRRNQSGMTAGAELTGWRLRAAKTVWRAARWPAIGTAWVLNKLGLHKQWVNRCLAPWQWVKMVITATDYDGFYSLRIHPAAQPDIRVLATKMLLAHAESVPTMLNDGDWHLPYITASELASGVSHQDLAMVSAGRVAGTSYVRGPRGIEAELALAKRLLSAVPAHASPFEAQSMVDSSIRRSGNFTGGWVQFRHLLGI